MTFSARANLLTVLRYAPSTLQETGSEQENAGEEVSVGANDDNPIAHYRLWMQLIKADRFHQARKLAQERIDASDDEAEKHKWRARLGRAKGNEDLAAGVSYIEKAIEDRPADYQGFLELAMLYADFNRYENSFATLDKGIETIEDNAPLRGYKASQVAAYGETEEAIEMLEAVIEEQPQYGKAHAALAKIFVDGNTNDKGKAAFKAGLKQAPHDKDLLTQYGNFAMNSADYEAALATFTTLNKIYPDNALYLASLGNAYFESGLHGLALDAYQKANVLAGEKNPAVIENIGNTYSLKRLNPQAIDFLKKALELNPDSVYAHERLAAAIQRNKDEGKKAAEMIRRYAQTSRSNPQPD